ncbi:hypothetical protein VRRI112168_19355 [Vreelandella rituensis]|uniref:Lipoprotein n=1 Tax=Vreelandella rituensis TaxID=2282306 RepID=A0A368TMN9_9GAMM|nr:hypothetical protein [Halomonas rituensis]RCV85818.1 hypothetical protein DU506_20145 [Halomonas rituensis]
MVYRHGMRVLAVAAMLVLSGCGGNNDAVDEAPEPQPEQQSEVVTPESEEAVEPLEVAVSLSVSLRNDRRLVVEGETNLPDGARLQVVVEHKFNRVSWQARTEVEQGYFVAGPFGSSTGLADGEYQVRVQLSEASVQPDTVQQRIGEQGQHLAGELVRTSKHGLGQIAVYTKGYMIGSESRRSQSQAEVIEDPT